MDQRRVSFQVRINLIEITFHLSLSLMNFFESLALRNHIRFELSELKIAMMQESFCFNNALSHLLSFMAHLLRLAKEVVVFTWLAILLLCRQLLVSPVHIGFGLLKLINSILFIFEVGVNLTSLILQLLKLSKELHVPLSFLLHSVVDALRILNQNLHCIILLLPDLLQYCR